MKIKRFLRCVEVDLGAYAEGVGKFQPGVVATRETTRQSNQTLKELKAHRPNTFSVADFLGFLFPGLQQPWAEISQRLRRMPLNQPPRNAKTV